MPRKVMSDVVWRIVWLAIALGGCDADSPTPPTTPAAAWPCPRGWVRASVGGCAPALIVCGDAAREANAMAGACAGVDVRAGVATTQRDGSAGPTLRRGDDGAIEGPWPREGAPDGETTPPSATWLPTVPDDAPAEAWTPTAGIAGCTNTWPCNPALRSDCPAGSAALPSGACVATGNDVCPPESAGPWPDPGAVAAGVRVVRVRAGATAAGADGSEARPFATIADALAAGTGPVRALLGDGDHVAPARIEGTVTLLGRCPSRARLTPAEGAGGDAPIELAGGAIELAGLSLRGRGVSATAGATVRLRSVVVADAPGTAVRAGQRARVELRDVYVDGTTNRAGAQLAGLFAEGGATLDGERVVVRGALRSGILAGAASVTLRDAAVRGVVAAAGVPSARGVEGQSGAQLALTRVLIEGTVGSGVLVTGAGTRATLDASALRQVSPTASSAGAGLAVTTGATATLRGSLVERSGGSGAYGRTANTRLEVSDCLFVANGDPSQGAIELSSRDGATVTATGVLIRDTAGVGLHAAGAGSTLNATRVRIERVDQDGMGRGARGLLAQEGGALTAAELRVTDVRGVGASAVSAGSRLTLDRAVFVGGSAPRVEPVLVEGLAIAAIEGGTVEATRARVVRANTLGVESTGEGSALTLTASRVDGVVGRAGRPAIGLLVLRGASLVARGVRVHDAGTSSLGASGEGSRVELEDAIFDATRAGTGETLAVLVDEGAAVTGARVAVTRSAGGGVLALNGARATFQQLRVADSDGRRGYGVSVQDGGVVEASRVRVSRSTSAGAFAAGADAALTLRDAVLEQTRPGSQGGGYGARAQSGGAITLARALVADNTYIALVARNEATRLSLADVAVRGTRPIELDGRSASLGLVAIEGAVAEADRVVVSGFSATGVGVVGATFDANELYVLDPALAGPFGGFGALVSNRATARLSRAAFVTSRGVGVSLEDARDATGTTLTARGLYVARVAEGPTSSDDATAMEAYGVSVGPGTSIDLTQTVLDGGGWGFFQTLGTVRMRDGVIARQRRGAGASNGVAGTDRLTIERVTFAQNGRDDVLRDVRLPPVRLSPPRLPD